MPTFPNAKYIVSRSEYEYWDAAYQRGDQRIHCAGFADSVLPVKRAEQIVIVDEHHQFDDGMRFEPCFGHSPGHIVVNIASKGATGTLSGDVIHHPVQLRFPAMSTMADTDRDLARATRTALIERLAGSGTLLLPTHFTDPTVGLVEAASEGFSYNPIEG